MKCECSINSGCTNPILRNSRKRQYKAEVLSVPSSVNQSAVDRNLPLSPLRETNFGNRNALAIGGFRATLIRFRGECLKVSLVRQRRPWVKRAAEGLDRERSRTRTGTEPGRSLRILGPDSDGKCGHLKSPLNSSGIDL